MVGIMLGIWRIVSAYVPAMMIRLIFSRHVVISHESYTWYQQVFRRTDSCRSAQVLLSLSTANQDAWSTVEMCADIVGTGGDGFSTFNASTAAALVVAGCGFRVRKHGNRSASSLCGSADLIETLGCPIGALKPQHYTGPAADCPFAFLFAQTFYPCLKQVAMVRRELGFPTIFNFLGPLLNPARPQCIVLGVNSVELGLVLANVLPQLGIQRAWVVHGAEGLDEISPCGPTHVWQVQPDGSSHGPLLIQPIDFGFDPVPSLDLVRGGTADENAAMLNRLLDDGLGPGDPVLQFVLMNAAALLVVTGNASSLVEGVQMGRQSIGTGRARSALREFLSATCPS